MHASSAEHRARIEDPRSRVVVMGLGRFGGGVGVTQFFAKRGCRVLVTDVASRDDLAQSIARLDGLPVDFRVGEPHREEDFANADVVVVNPAVKPAGNKFIQAALAAGAMVTSEIRLLVAYLPNRLRTIGITGSAGKSTTTAMLGHILRQRLGPDRVHVGGNIGGSLLGDLEGIQPDDWVVLELSSFMLESLRAHRWSPHIAAVTNFSPNHLDWHADLADYQHAKQSIFDYQVQAENDVAILGPGVCQRFTPRVSRMHSYALQAVRAAAPLPLRTPGLHNQINAAVALDIAKEVGIARDDAIAALADFAGLPHRLQFVAERAGVRYYNDSKATTPEAAMLGIESFPAGSVHVILGGSDKGSDLSSLAALAVRHCRGIYTIGATGDAIAAAAERAGTDDMAASVHGPAVNYDSCGSAGWAAPAAHIERCGTLPHALSCIAGRIKPGDAVLLSPGCASYGEFRNFEHRGATFTELVTTSPPRP